MKRSAAVSLACVFSGLLCFSLWSLYQYPASTSGLASGPDPDGQAKSQPHAVLRRWATQADTAPTAAATIPLGPAPSSETGFQPGTEQVMPRSPKMTELRRITAKVLRNAADRARFSDLLRDDNVLTAAYLIVAHDGAVAHAEDGMLARAAVMEYFHSALGDAANPLRSELRSVLEALILRPVDRAKLTEDSKFLIAQDRVLLFQMLRKNFPEAATELVNRTSDPRLLKLMALADADLPNHGARL